MRRTAYLPKKIKVGHVEYEIKKIKNPKLDNEEVNAYIEFNKGVIAIKDDLVLPVEKCTCVHELLHGILYNSSIPESDEIHQVIDALANGLIGIIQENPKLIKYLQS